MYTRNNSLLLAARLLQSGKIGIRSKIMHSAWESDRICIILHKADRQANPSLLKQRGVYLYQRYQPCVTAEETAGCLCGIRTFARSGGLCPVLSVLRFAEQRPTVRCPAAWQYYTIINSPCQPCS